MRMYDIIEKKRDGGRLEYEEIRFFVEGYLKGAVPDYQAAALLMAIFLKGLDSRETADLTMAMADSGERLSLAGIEGIKVDKHSTGGVGDKTTLVLGPMVAACGVPVAKMSGRGLGHTGGTIDKLESIPGFKTEIPIEKFTAGVKETGIAIAGQTANLAPADKKLYSLRDVTATVNSIPLIASSIMSKKIASGADRIVLDVKVGSGAFMKSLDEAVKLAEAMVGIGERVGKKTVALITGMDAPLGAAIGNSLEVIEAIETLKGNGPEDLEELCIELASVMLELAGKGQRSRCREMALESLASGKAFNKLLQLIESQGGDKGVADDYGKFKQPKFIKEVFSTGSGYIYSMKTDLLGKASVVLGAGRETKESAIDPSAGILLYKKTGMRVEKGEAIARLQTDQEERLEAAERMLTESLEISREAPRLKPVLLAEVDSSGVKLL